MWLRLAVRAWIVVVLATGCSTTGSGKPASTSPRIAGIEFIQAPAFVLAECHSTARQVGYAVPCPRRIPTSLHPLGGTSKCPVAIIGPAGQGGCSHQWRGWVVGSSIAGQEHLVIQAAPTVVVDPAKAIDGPGWYPGATVQLLGTSTIAGQNVKLYDVPPATNDGSAFAGHVVMVWSSGGHTYSLGFHNLTGVRATTKLDTELMRWIKLVEPAS